MAGRTGQPERSASGALRLARELTELYAVPPEEFVAERRRRAGELRRDGEPRLATELAGARKPTQAAWLVDQLSRAEPALLGELLDLPEGFAAAYRDGDAARLRAVTDRRNQLLTDLRDAAARAAAERAQPFSPATADQVGTTLSAALSDPAVAAEIRAGTLTRPVTYSGFGPFGPLAATATSTATSTSTRRAGTDHPSRRPRRHLEPADPAPDPGPPRESPETGTGHETRETGTGRESRETGTGRESREKGAVEERRRRAEEREQAARERQRLRDEAAVRRAEEAHAEAAEHEQTGREKLHDLDRRLVELRDELRGTMRERDRAARRHDTLTTELEAATRRLTNARDRLTPDD
jgi:hypothetical protein